MRSTTDHSRDRVHRWGSGFILATTLLAGSSVCGPSDDPAGEPEEPTTTGTNFSCASSPTGEESPHRLADGPLDDLDIPHTSSLCPDTAHNYAFTLTTANYFIAESRFDRQLGNLRMSVLDGQDKVLWTSTGGDLALIHRLLPAGPYVLRLESLEGTLSYALRVRALPTTK